MAAAAAAASTLATAHRGDGGNSRRRRAQRPVALAAASSSADGEAASSAAAGSTDADEEVKRAKPAAVQPPSEPKPDKGPIQNFIDTIQNLGPEEREDVKTFFVSLSVALFIRSVFVEPRFIPSLSMYPTFDVGDQLTVDKISKNWRDYQRRDVVVFNPPPAFNAYVGADRAGEALIKRIVALEGDVVQVKAGGDLFINGEKQEETFTNEKAAYEFGPVTVPKGCVLVLGDNRNASLDGHIWGPLPLENIIGRATLKFWPPWHVGTVEASPP